MMPLSAESALATAAAAIEPTRAQKAGAARSHAFLRDVLRTGNMAERIVASYLSGSYARSTAVRPLDDVDILFIIDPAKWPKGWMARLPPPESVLTTFERAIRYRYPDSSLRVQRRSVRLRLNHLDIDVVPVVPTPGDPEIVEIPDVDKDDWILTAPAKHSTNAARVNEATGGLFKPLVKLLKHWNYMLPQQAQAKSFMIETIAVRLFNAVSLPTLTKGVRAYFDLLHRLSSVLHLSAAYGMNHDLVTGLEIPDVAETGSNTAAGMDRARRRAFFAAAEKSRNLLARVRQPPEERAADFLRALKFG
jgi:hypothetical protein